MQLTADLPIVDPSEGLVSDALREGLMETGFLYLRDRSIPIDKLHRLRRETYAFFARPLEEKMHYHAPARGFVALREEHSTAGFGTGAYGSGDCCEKFTMGPMVDEAIRRGDPDYYFANEASDYFADNIFPNAHFQTAWEEYYRCMMRVATDLMQAIRKLLGLPEGRWTECIDRPVSVLRFLSYPEVFTPGQRLAPHYDNDLVTILHQSPTANGFDGLEVMLPGESVWRSVPADDELFVVNVGDALTYLTEGRVVATKHRVASPPKELLKGSGRSSIVFFHMPNWNARLYPKAAAAMDHGLGQSSTSFHLDDLKEADGSVLFYKVLEREISRQKAKSEDEL